MPIDLVLVRHGESELNAAISHDDEAKARLLEGRVLPSETRLTKLGRKQAKTTGKWLRQNFPDGFGRYYTSEYVRAMETASLLGLPDAQWNVEFYLRERERGEMDVPLPKHIYNELYPVAKAAKDRDPFFWRPPNGESMADVCLRVDRVISTLHRECENMQVLIVCHGETMLAFRARLMRLTIQEFARIELNKNEDIRNGQVYHFTRRVNPYRTPFVGVVKSQYPATPANPVNVAPAPPQIIRKGRQDFDGGWKKPDVSDKLRYFRSVDPNGKSPLKPDWIPIDRTRPSNKDLQERVEKFESILE